MPRRWFWIFFILVVFLAGVLRIWQLGRFPVSVYWDEAAMLVDIKSVLATGRDMHNLPWYQLIYPSYGDYKLPVYIWAAAVSCKVFGLSEFGLRLPSALAGVFTVIIAGALIRVLLQIGTKTPYRQKFLELAQLLTMVVVAITPWSVMFSRTAFEGHLAQALFGASMLATAWGLYKKELRFFLLAGLIGSLATYTYFSVRFVWPFVYLGVSGLAICRQQLLFSWKKLQFPWQALIHSLAGSLVFVIVLIPLLRSPLAKDADRFRLGTDSVLNNEKLAIQSNVYRQLAGNTFIDRVFYHRYWLMFRELAKNYSDNLSGSFLFVNGDPNLRHGTGQFGLFLLAFVPAFIVGLIVLLKRHPSLGLFLIGWWFIALLPASVPENTPHALRSLNALIPLSMIIGFGTTWWWIWLSRYKLQLIIVLLYAGSFLHFWWFYTQVYPKLSANDWQSGYKPLAQKITQLAKDGQTIVIQPFDDRFYLWLMAYGPYSAKEFQGWPSENYKFQTDRIDKNFARIEFGGVDQSKLAKKFTEGQSFIVAGETKSIEQYCSPPEGSSCTLVVGENTLFAKSCPLPNSYRCNIQYIHDEVWSNKLAIATFTR